MASARFQRILVPVDGSVRAAEAVEVARHLAQRTGACVILLRVEQPLTDVDQVIQINRDLERQVAELRAQGVEARHDIEIGRPERGITAVATYDQSDLLIMAPHHRAGMEALRHPSVTAHMFSRSPVPILVWPEKAPGKAYASFLNVPGAGVLVGLDGSDLAEQAIPYAQAFAREYACPLLLARVVVPLAVAGAGPEAYRLVRQAQDDQVHEAQEYLKGVRLRLASSGLVAVQSLLLRGEPVRELLRVAETHDGSLLVLSTHRRSGLSRLVMGSIAMQVMRESPLPLLVVPPRATSHRAAVVSG